jgi:hypothetical protein
MGLNFPAHWNVELAGKTNGAEAVAAAQRLAD